MANHRCAVLGKPVAHSLSPVLHNAAYRSLKLDDWLYDKHEVGEDDLDAFLKGLGWPEPDHAVEEDHPTVRCSGKFVGQGTEGGEYRGIRLERGCR